ncbi:acyltransferase [Cupriavidus campinensis]
MDKRVDLLRVTACFMVVLLHISALNIHEFGPKWWAANLWDSLSRASVPLFFMISGATLLPKSETVSVFLRKRASRILVPLLLWSSFYLWWLQYNGVDTGNWLVAIIGGPTMYHLWYFYAIIGIYMFVPVMRKFYQGSTTGEKLWFLSVWFVVASVFPLAKTMYLGVQGGFLGQCFAPTTAEPLYGTYGFAYFGGYMGYMFLGAFLKERKAKAGPGFAIFLLATAGTMAATYLQSVASGQPCELFYLYFSPLIVAAAAALFYAFHGLSDGAPSPALRYVSDCTLGVYGLHAFMIDPLFMRNGLFEITGISWVDPILASIGVFLACLGVIGLLRWPKPMRYLFG